jgi:hypothetical protein
MWRTDLEGDRTLTPRYVLWLVEHLPQDSSTIASMKGGLAHRQWTAETYMLASLVNLTFSANRQRAGKPTRKAPVQPPKISSAVKKAATPKRVVRISQLRSARKNQPEQ